MTTTPAAPSRAIAVFGAYGHTAGFVVAELLDRGWTPILAGRDEAKLRRAHPGREVRVASADDPESLDNALAGAAAVINCAGPFADTTPAVVEAAFRAGIHYLDVTGESLVAIDTFERYAARARDAGLVVAPSMGFFGALGDLLATAAMGTWASADDITVAVALDSWLPTRGTRLAGQRRAGRRVVFANGRLVVRSGESSPPHTTWEFPAPVGAQDVVGELSTVDVVTIARHLRVRDIHAYLNVAPIRDLSDPATPGPTAADDSGRSAQTFLVEVVARRGDERRGMTARGRDIYAITAPIVVEAAERLVEGRFTAPGVAAAGELFDADDFLRTLSEKHLTVDTRTPGAV
ncbi:saccharopine dehydrogenase family protein [Actinokineospora sp.]|uniref:saccharopine dehydrogenase family protein n=1 Tax=Actinokineospora sp. TaxID=1872133 RepID=UPI0040381F7D